MFYAVIPNGTRIRPTHTGQTAFCASCNGKVISKCGRINIWHWSHTSTEDCDSWSEPITIFHQMLQNGMEYNGAQIEIPIRKNNILHRADAVFPNGKIVEVQCSPLSPDDIEKRECFYENMVWLFDIQNAYDSQKFLVRENKGYFTFRWKHPQKSITYANKPVYLYLGLNLLFKVETLYKNIPCGGWGQIITWSNFLNEMKK